MPKAGRVIPRPEGMDLVGPLYSPEELGLAGVMSPGVVGTQEGILQRYVVLGID